MDLVFLIECLFDRCELTPFELGALIDFHRSAARMSAPNISFKTARSPNAFGMILRRRRSSTNNRSSKFVVRIARRCVTGNRRYAIQASKSSMKQATALSYVRP